MAAPAWVRFYRDGWKERGAEWEAPDGLVDVVIDPETGGLAGEWCPLATREWFRVGTEPHERCESHDSPGLPAWIASLEDEIADRLSRVLKRLGRGRQ